MLSYIGIENRRYPVGAELRDGIASFRVWAPERGSISLVLDSQSIGMQRENDGHLSCLVEGLHPGARYWFRIDGNERLEADPASRWQPQGPGGPSALADPEKFDWTDAGWRGVERAHQVLYEMHVGTFTPEGTWGAAMRKLPLLREIGITVIEMMPVNAFFGEFGWGYDGVLLYAPTHLYGEPDDLRAFVDEAHRLGIGVILDVVYNHFGPGDRFEAFSSRYFTDRYENEWGRSLNFDGPGSEGVRAYVSQNAAYWIDEFHFDGLRLDATQCLFDASERHIVGEIAEACRRAGGARAVYLLAENEPQHARLLRPPEAGGDGLDAVWNDDFHRSATVAATGRNEAYYHDHKGQPQEFVSAAKYGYLFQGQRYDWQDKARGTPALGLAPCNFVHFLQNHDQIANSAKGLRISALTSQARLRALTALLLLGPQTPMLFQGQEFGSGKPFLYFADNSGEMAELVSNGRREFISQFPSVRDEVISLGLADPADSQTFDRSKLDWAEFEANAHVVALHRDLLAIRRSDRAIRRAADARTLDASVLGALAFLIRYFGDQSGDDRILFVNIGPDLRVESIPDPLFAPPAGRQWTIIWSSEDARYGGTGQRSVDFRRRWTLTGNSALFLAPEEAAPEEEAISDQGTWQDAISS